MANDGSKYNWFHEYTSLHRELRAKGRGYQGLENPLANIQEAMLRDFRQSAMVDHAGDKGTVREDILRQFLLEKHYLPRRFGVSTGSSHVLSSRGRISAQMDLVIFDADNSPRLLDLGDTQYFPVECVYGVVEVKSDLNSTDRIKEGLDTIASFKRLAEVTPRAERKQPPGTAPTNGFGILFAYTSSLRWGTVIDCVQAWQANNPSSVWPNLVVSLDHGIIIQMDESRSYLYSKEIATR